MAALRLAEVELEPWEDVDDPAGGDLPEFEACAREIHDLVAVLASALDARDPNDASGDVVSAD